ncbi:hypothetical protein MXF29_06115 [Pseudomonas sp. NC26]|uniref:Uncharacterized protein n=1 Tax=Pseudomonas putida TaxID=303 RepID=A0A7W2QHN7_PSEPU|nr:MULTISPECIES: hypothetical protein [Pseudomonas]MBA6114988.1 hypothetical protein [Pseudomonas putida]MCZ9637095.1 hypothetical protein [Pseudomonas putida]MEC4875171.1 hypothetical protein [Pseudomonas sp. NC26]QNL87599.1 Uncharacterized protein PPKH_2185 [Pseudomonas putida]
MSPACEVWIPPKRSSDDLIEWLRMLMRAERAGAPSPRPALTPARAPKSIRTHHAF